MKRLVQYEQIISNQLRSLVKYYPKSHNERITYKKLEGYIHTLQAFSSHLVNELWKN